MRRGRGFVRKRSEAEQRTKNVIFWEEEKMSEEDLRIRKTKP
jgi:hypothetical protein